MKSILGLLLMVAVLIAAVVYYRDWNSGPPPVRFRTTTVERGDLRAMISATGTVEPEEVVDVGAQVAGKINFFGPDPRAESEPRYKNKFIDYGSPVHVGTVLAQIDDSVYRAQRDQALASRKRTQADLGQFLAKLLQAEQERKRAEDLRKLAGNIKGIADTDYDLVVANHDVAKANVEVAKAAVEQAEAALKLAQTNLDYTVIRSPVEGVIVDRRVNVGQTVVASLNAPSLFLIAKDLSKMQVWASVNEADIGRIRSRKDMPVRFTVDAYPGEVFHGKVDQVRLNATMTQNVVTYTVVVAFDNSNMKLLPYLTANLQFEIEERHDVLLVPNAALRWRPRLEQVSPEIREEVAPLLVRKRSAESAPGAKTRSAASGSGRPPQAERPSPETPRLERGRLWIADEDFVRPIEVELGSTDGSNTEIRGDAVKEGLQVVTGEIRNDPAAGSDGTNPFAPKIFRKSRQ